ncbi:MAG TPA: DUF2269 family protein [Acidimicrobiia bacterium]|nr:DUF2269 family protein [Acidimicrobiia bacterium]
MGINGFAYKLVFVLHILSAIVGFGGVVLNGLYGWHANKRRGAEGLAIVETNFAVSEVCAKFIYAVPVFGFGLVFLSDGIWSFHQTWLWLALAVYVGALGLSHGVLRPTVQRMIVLMHEMSRPPVGVGPDGRALEGAAPAGPPPQAAEMAELGQKAGATGAVLNLALVVVLVLMVWKPGV